MPTSRSPVLRTTAWFAGAYGLAIGANAFHLGDVLWRVLVRPLDHSWETLISLDRLSWMYTTQINSAYLVALVAATLLVPLGAVVRTVARARVRAGFKDPLERPRRFAKRPLAVAVLTLAPAVSWLALTMRVLEGMHEPWDTLLPALALPIGAAFVAHTILARRGLRALLAPTLRAEESTGEAARADGFTFNAVAVTTETVGAVAGLAALSLVVTTLALVLPTNTLVRDPAFLTALAGYVALAIGAAALFQRASRISVGLDGIFVSGSARARFVPFSEIDGVRTNGSTLEILRGERKVVRLQLHGEDAMRRDALAERIRDAIAVAASQRNEPAVDFVRRATSDALDRAADGAANYREAAPTREKLWEVLESPAVDAAGRKAAAGALAREPNASERVRLRVAAEQCAEPSVRARIHELLAEDDGEPLVPARKMLSATR